MKKIIITITLLTMATLSMAQHYRNEFSERVGKLFYSDKLSEITILYRGLDNDTVWTEVSEETKQRIQGTHPLVKPRNSVITFLKLNELDKGEYRIICKDPIKVCTLYYELEAGELRILVCNKEGLFGGECMTTYTIRKELITPKGRRL